MNLAQRADGVIVDPGLDGANQGAVPGGHKVRCHFRLTRGFNNQSRLAQPIRDRLVHQNVPALFHRRDGDGRVKMIGGHHLDRIDMLLPLQ